MPEQRDWAWWSEAKLGILGQYLEAFATASKKASERVYLDLFAGSYENKRRDGEGCFPGSSQIAFNIEPAFTRVALFERPGKAKDLRLSIQDAEPHDVRCWEVFSGDCNIMIDKGLNYLEIRWAPTFAFLDPCGLQVNWATLKKLASWKRKGKPKMEMLILFPEPALPRVMGAEFAKGKTSIDSVNNVYGTNEWLSIYQLHRKGSLNASNLREELVNLYRWRLETKLGYEKTHAIGIGDNNRPLYTLIFATDHQAGDKIMEHIYKSFYEIIIPIMQDESNRIRKKNRGQDTLEGIVISEIETPQSTLGYKHFAPRPPPPFEGKVCFDEVTEMTPAFPFAWSED